MRYNSTLSILALVIAAAGPAAYAAESSKAEGSAAAKPLAGQELVKNAKISLVDARAIALKAHPGTIADEELENEKGGSGLRYTFEIKFAKGVQEVGVDAMTGKILENKLEGPHPD